MFRFGDRIKETSTTTGTGNFTLAGAVSQFESFTSNFVDGEQFYYAIVGQTGTEWEVGFGSLSSGALVRTQVLQSSNSNALVSFSAGTKDVFCTISGEYMRQTSTWGQQLAANQGALLP